MGKRVKAEFKNGKGFAAALESKKMKKIILVLLVILAIGLGYFFLARRQNIPLEPTEASSLNSDPAKQISGETSQPQTQRPNTPEQNMYSAAAALKPSPSLPMAENAKAEWNKCFPDMGEKLGGNAWKNLDSFWEEAKTAAGGVESEDLLSTEKTFKSADGILQRLKFTSDQDRDGNLLVRMQLFSKKGEGWEEIAIPRDEQENPDPKYSRLNP